ncbi:hypothetical protein [Myxacorys almedinensis]|uniref:hypothetical protein n=1 Tax=Myxacorys almedinensis TaxID=2651157 RepID=UPI00192EFE2A|nr:hypothetical protein [Myxacorys almedinensis]
MHVLDTNTLIYYFKGQGQVAQNLASMPAQDISVSTIVLFEWQVGIAKSTSPANRTQQLQHLIKLLTIKLLTIKILTKKEGWLPLTVLNRSVESLYKLRFILQ